MEHQAQSKTFRLHRIPPTYKTEALKSDLDHAWGLGGVPNCMDIKSLADNAENPGTQVATLDFQEIPEALTQTKANLNGTWEVKIKNYSGRDSKNPLCLTLDTNFLGLTTLASPLTETHKLDVIAVAGLGGHAFGSFKERGESFMWLRDSLPGDLEGTRVMIYGHDSHLHNSDSVQDIDALGRSFAQTLSSISREFSTTKVLIGHSLGGLIIKQAIIMLAKWGDCQEVLESIRAVMFFAVPSLGMSIGSLVPIVRGKPNESLLRMLEPGSHILRDQRIEFKNCLENLDIEVFCYYETKKSPTAQQNLSNGFSMDGPMEHLVSFASAQHGREWERGSNVDAIDETHSNIVKFTKCGHTYFRVLSKLKGISVRALTKRQTECLRSLAFAEINKRLYDIPVAAKKTCEWIFDDPEFRKWRCGKTGVLWIKGKPGSGKSTLFKHVITRLEPTPARSQDYILLSFLFHGRGTELEKTPVGLFRALSHQLFKQMPHTFPRLVKTYFERKETLGNFGENWLWHAREIQAHFKSALSTALKQASVMIMVDALDECGEMEARELIEDLQNMAVELRLQNFLRIFFTSRHYPTLTLDYGVYICTEERNQSDIAAFVDDASQKLLRHGGQEIRDRICERAQGVFLWVALVLAKAKCLVQEGQSTKAILERISAVPTDLSNIYRGLLNSMKECDRTEALKLMRWICYSCRPLTLKELYFAVAFQTREPPCSFSECQNRATFPDDDEQMHRRLLHLSRGLVEVRQLKGTKKLPVIDQPVQFIHQTVQDFVTSEGLKILLGSNSPEEYTKHHIHYMLSWACYHCIAVKEVRHLISGLTCSRRQTKVLFDDDPLASLPFATYATRYFFQHLRLAQDTQHNSSKVAGSLHELGSELKSFPTIWKLLSWQSSFFGGRSVAGNATILHLISAWGLRTLLPISLIDWIDILDLPDGFCRSALAYAAIYGHDLVVKQLLNTGRVNVNLRDFSGRSPLIHAANKGNDNVVKLLLDTNSAEVDLRDSDGRSALTYAASGGHDTIVKQLLDTNIVNVNSRDHHGRSALSWAAKYGRDTVVKRLIGVDGVVVDIRDLFDRSPLMLAARYANDIVVKLLLDTGAVDVNTEDENYETPLSYATRAGYAKVVQVLLDTGGADLNAEDEQGSTLLSHAARLGHAAVVKSFLDTGMVDINHIDQLGNTPLSLAARYQRKAVVELLLATDDIVLTTRANLMEQHSPTGELPIG